MTAAIKFPLKAAEGTACFTVADFVLLRVAAGGANRADLQRDLAALFAPHISGTEFRRTAEAAIGAHEAQHLLTDTRGRLRITAAGEHKVATQFHGLATDIETWAEIRDALAIRGLGITASAAVLKALQRPESLAALILQQNFELATIRVLSPTTLRAELAIVALERAFGNKIKTGLGKGSGLPGKAGRLLAGQLFSTPREFSSDGKLILALAREVAGTSEASVEAFKVHLIRRLTSPHQHIAEESKTEPRKPRAPAPKPDNDPAPLAKIPPPTTAPPDLVEFCGAVVSAARPIAEGWPGNRKAFISLVWKAIRHTHPEWGLSEIAFKSMLAEAHRSGRVELVGADLKEGRDLKELEDSKILYKNTVWLFVRVED
jgi:hypothetical protein